jgi:uncharacterized small protein (DUF1192 family)
MSSRIAVALSLALALVACQKQGAQPLATPSSDQPGYAVRYPDALAAARNRLADHESQARRLMGTFASFPDGLDNPNWPDVVKVYEAADAAGHSAEYVERLEQGNAVSTFFAEEKDEIDKKVGGAANYTAKQKGCTADLYGATAGALDKAVEKQLEKRLRARNEAHGFIDAHEDSLRKPNREKLEKQADDISLTSYLVRVGAEQAKRHIKDLLEEANHVKATLDWTIEESKATAADAKRSDAEKKKATARREAAEKAKSRIDQETQDSQKLLEEVDQRIQQLRDEYDKAFDELKKKTASKGNAKA